MDIERRKTSRNRVDLHCWVQVQLPTATHPPGGQPGLLVELDACGARVTIPDFSEELYRKLLGGRGCMRVSVRPGAREGRGRESLELAGRVVWMDYQSHPARLVAGLELDGSDPEVIGVVRKILEATGVPRPEGGRE